MRGQKIAAGDPADDLARRVSRDDGKAAHIFIQHVVSGFAKRVVFEDDGGRIFESLEERRGFRLRGIEDLAPGDDAGEKPVAIEDREALMLGAGNLRRKPRADVTQGVVGSKSYNIPCRGVLDEDLVEEVGGVLSEDANAAAGDFFGHDGVAHQERGDEEGSRAAAEQAARG